MRLDMIATAAAVLYIHEQAPMQRIFKILMQRSLEKDFNRISTRSSHKHLYEIV
jgi:hypothetical protein